MSLERRLKGKRKPQMVTMMLVPDSGQTITSRRVSLHLVRMASAGVAALILLLALTAFLSTRLYLAARAEIGHLHQVEIINATQAEEIERAIAQSEGLAARFSEIEQLDQQVRSLVGLSERKPLTVLAGRGGGQASAPPPEQVDQLRISSSNLQSVFAALPEQQLRLSSLQAYLDALPTQWPVVGPISSPYGYRASPFTGETQYHDGIDIMANYGEEVRAAGAGRVYFAGTDGVYGKVVRIEHGYGYRTSYCHNSELLVKEGEEVERGQLIAKAGSTGLSTGPHLHFIVQFRGENKDPMQYLNLSKRGEGSSKP